MTQNRNWFRSIVYCTCNSSVRKWPKNNKKIQMNTFDMSNWRYSTCCVMFMTVFFRFFLRRFSYLSAGPFEFTRSAVYVRAVDFFLSFRWFVWNSIRAPQKYLLLCTVIILDVFNLVVSSIVFSSFPLFFVVSRYRFTCIHALHGNIWHNERWIRALISHYFDAINSLAVPT